MPRNETGASGCDASVVPLCHAAPQIWTGLPLRKLLVMDQRFTIGKRQIFLKTIVKGHMTPKRELMMFKKAFS